jgi:site-specific recombinase XerD
LKPSSVGNGFGTLLQEFFLERLIQQRNASAQTVASYRDSFRLLLRFAQRHLGKTPECLALTDLDASLVLAFLNHLESERHNTIRSRNLRFAAIRSFLHFAALKEPETLPTIQRVLAIPSKRFDRPLLGFLSRPEVQSILNAPDGDTWSGMRDRTLLATLYNTGARVSEVIGLSVADVVLDGSSSVRIQGKGRKQRSVPLRRATALQIRHWLPHIDSRPDRPLFPSCSGIRLTRSAVTARLQLAVQHAAATCPSLTARHISPHTVRHSTAMHMLQAGVDITLIALWLGHESPTTTHAYVEVDLGMKQRALDAVHASQLKPSRYQPGDRILKFLESL